MGAAIGEITGANRRAAQAAQQTAQARETQARENLAFQKESQERALGLAESPQELAALGRSLEVQEKSLARQERLAANIDPAILEAGSQALQLLRGEEAGALKPIRDQRQRQRQQLLNSLREQLGPGAETSTAGIQALTRFDQETSSVLAGQQQSSLQQLFGFGATQDDRLARQAAGFRGIAGGFGNIAGRRVGAITGTAGGIAAAGRGVAEAAGSQFVGQAVRAGQLQQFGSDVFQVGTFAAAGGFGGGGLFGKNPALANSAGQSSLNTQFIA